MKSYISFTNSLNFLKNIVKKTVICVNFRDKETKKVGPFHHEVTNNYIDISIN